MDSLDLTRETVEINPYEVGDECVSVLRDLIVEQSNEIEHDDIETIETLVLDGSSGGLTSHANIFINTDNTTTESEQL